MAEHPMFDFVPLARAWRKVTHADVQAQVPGQALEFHLPEPGPVTVAAAGVGRDEQPSGPRVAIAAHLPPPTSNCFDGKLCRVVINAYAHPSLIGQHVVNPIRGYLTQLGVGKVVSRRRLRLPRRLPLPSLLCIISDKFLLFGVHPNHLLASSLELP